MEKGREKKRIYLSSPTMHGKEQEFVQEAFDTNWVAPLGPNVKRRWRVTWEFPMLPH